MCFARTLGLLALLAQDVPGQVSFTPVGVTGLPAPGIGGAQFSAFGGAALSAHGDVAFYAVLTGLGVGAQNNSGVWAGSPRAPLVAGREGNRPPGTASGVMFDSFGNPALGAGGHVAFGATLTGLGIGSQNDAGIWAGLPAAVQLAARKGAVPPGIANASVQFSDFGAPAVDASGAVAFNGAMTGLGIGEFNDTGIWAGAPGVLRLAAREGNVPPGIGNASVQFASFGRPAINAGGGVAFNATVTGLGIGEENDTGIWAGPADALTLVAREGNRPPDAGASVMFRVFDDVVLNTAGQIAFGATVTGLGVGLQNDTGIWGGAPGALRLVAREGGLPPGVGGNDVQFDSFGPPVLSAGGQIAFKATLTGLGIGRENREGVWAGPLTAPALLARAGDRAPETPNGAMFLSFEDPVFTGAGTVAFYAKLTGLGVGVQNDAGIWASDTAGQLRLVVREGEFLDGGDIVRQINSTGLKLFPQQGGEALDASGIVQLLFQATFIDGTNGLFVATLGSPRIQSVASTGGSLQIQFQSVSALVYGVEFTADLAGNHWQLLPGIIVGTGGLVTVADSILPGQPARIYRLKILPGR